MFVLGLTGSIGMGKSTAAKMFAMRGVPVHDADAEVHRLYRGQAVAPIADAFPEAVLDGTVDRARLSDLVVGNEDRLRELEEIVHPLVQAAERDFLATAFDAGSDIALLEVPLLLEGGGTERVDAVVMVSAGTEIQRERVLARGGMTEQKFAAILARQMPDSEKRRHAHFILDSGQDLAFAQKQVDDVLRALAGRTGSAYSRRNRSAAD